MSKLYDKSIVKRSDIDDYARRNSDENSYKNRQFNEKEYMLDEYTGKKIYKNTHNNLTTTQISNTDHITPIEKIRDIYGDKLSTNDMRKMANADWNLAMVQQNLNQSKGKKTNVEYLIHKAKIGDTVDIMTTYNMVKSQIESETVNAIYSKGIQLNKHISKGENHAINYINEHASHGIYKGMDSAIVTMTTSSINNIVMCAMGDKSMDEAANEILRDTGSSFISRASVDILKNISTDVGKKLNILSNKSINIAELSAVMVGNTVIKYINGDINEEQCIYDILLNGIGYMANILNIIPGGAAGSIIISVICSQFCKAITTYNNIDKLNEEKLRRVNSITAEALVEMEYQRNILKALIQEKYEGWDYECDEGFKTIFVSTFNNDIDGISSGINQILSTIGETVMFSSREEFNTFFDDEDAILEL